MRPVAAGFGTSLAPIRSRSRPRNSTGSRRRRRRLGAEAAAQILISPSRRALARPVDQSSNRLGWQHRAQSAGLRGPLVTLRRSQAFDLSVFTAAIAPVTGLGNGPPPRPTVSARLRALDMNAARPLTLLGSSWDGGTGGQHGFDSPTGPDRTYRIQVRDFIAR